MTPIWDKSGAVLEFVSAIAGDGDGIGRHRALGVIDDTGKLVAGLVFFNWLPQHGTIEVSAASTHPGWATRAVMKEAFSYIFDGCSCQMAYARTDTANERVRRLLKAVGASEHIIPRMRGREASEAILTVTQEAWTASRFNR